MLPALMHRHLAVLAVIVLVLPALVALVPPAPVRGQDGDVVISQLYVGGGSGNAPLNADFVELFNRGGDPVTLDGWSVQYASAAGTSWTAAMLTGTLPPGGFSLVSGPVSAAGAPLPTPDATGLPALSAEAGRVALVSQSAPLDCSNDPACATAPGVIDFLGYGTKAVSWHGKAAARSPGVDLALLRTGAGCTESTDNATDFRLRPPAPRTLTSPLQPCDPLTGLPLGGMPAIWSPSIRDIQGRGHVSPLRWELVIDVPGVVTAVSGNGFWMQDPVSDDDPATSEGILVFTGSRPQVRPGNAVLVQGLVEEFRPGGDADNLATTEIIEPVVQVVAPNHLSFIAPTVIGPGGRVLPTEIIDDDETGDVETGGTFAPTTDALDLWESLEGMLVTVDDAVVTGPAAEVSPGSFRLPVLAGNGASASERTPRGGIIISPLGDETDFNPERIILSSALLPREAQRHPTQRFTAANTSDQIETPITGVVDYSFGNFEVVPTAPFTLASSTLTPEVAAPAGTNELAVATFNVENLDPTDVPPTAADDAFARLAAIIVTNLRSPDLIMLEEVQDNTGPTRGDGVVDANITTDLLIDAITAAGGPVDPVTGESFYAYVDIDPQDGKDGGEPGGNIRVGFLFRTDRGLSFVEMPGGTATNEVTVVATDAQGNPTDPHLSFSPGRLQADTSDPLLAKAFDGTRKPLVGEFTYHGHTLFVIGNHWTSKQADEPLFGRFQPPELESEAKRVNQAARVRQFVDDLLDADPEANIIVLGDLNDFWFSPPLATLTVGASPDRDLLDLMTTLDPKERYGYVFEGNSQDLDHLVISPGLQEALVPGSVDVVHVNAEFADHASDHDPQVACFLLPAPA
jgi:predicted extracellular nuclease